MNAHVGDVDKTQVFKYRLVIFLENLNKVIAPAGIIQLRASDADQPRHRVPKFPLGVLRGEGGKESHKRAWEVVNQVFGCLADVLVPFVLPLDEIGNFQHILIVQPEFGQ